MAALIVGLLAVAALLIVAVVAYRQSREGAAVRAQDEALRTLQEHEHACRAGGECCGCPSCWPIASLLPEPARFGDAEEQRLIWREVHPGLYVQNPFH